MARFIKPELYFRNMRWIGGIMKELVEVIAKSLVENPDEVVVTETESPKETVVLLSVAASDMGRVIGKQGRVAKAIRTLMKSLGAKEKKRITIEFID